MRIWTVKSNDFCFGCVGDFPLNAKGQRDLNNEADGKNR